MEIDGMNVTPEFVETNTDATSVQAAVADTVVFSAEQKEDGTASCEREALSDEAEVVQVPSKEEEMYQRVLEKLDVLIDREKNISRLLSRIKVLEDDLEYGALKAVLKGLAGARDDMKRTVRGFKKEHVERDRYKDIKAEVISLKSILKRQGVVVNDEGYFYEDEPLKLIPVSPAFAAERSAQSIEIGEKNTIESKIDIIGAFVNSSWNTLLEENGTLISTLAENKKRAALLACAGLMDKLNSYIAGITELSESDYIDKLNETADDIVAILNGFGVRVENLETEVFNVEEQIALNIVETSNKEDDGKIAEILSDKYVYGDHVISEEKVAVYQYKAPTEPANN